MASGGTEASSNWLAPLDGLRGASILMVLTAHVYSSDWPKLGGRHGVTIFFVLSGFLITRLLVQESRKKGRIDFAAFFVRRSFRLFPLYYFILGVYALLIVGLNMHPNGRQGFVQALPWYAVYLQEVPFFNWNGTSSVPFYQSWSLGIEEKFYLVWPFLAFKLLGAPAHRQLAAALGVLLCSAAHFHHAGRYFFPYAAIFVGCYTALLDSDDAMRARMRAIFSGWGAALSLCGLGCLHVGAILASDLTASIIDVLYPVGAATLLLSSLSDPRLGKVLSRKTLVVLGQLSYGIYLTHLLVRQVVERGFVKVGWAVPPGIVVYAGMLAGSVAVAWVLQRTLEGPLRERGRAIAAGLTSRARTPALPG